jgi:ATP-dependent Lon protease
MDRLKKICGMLMPQKQEKAPRKFKSYQADPTIYVDFDISKKSAAFPFDKVELDSNKERNFDEDQFNPKTINETIHGIITEINNWPFGSKILNYFPNRLLLYGPPGTGKTTIAEIIARETLDSVFISVSGSNIVNKLFCRKR